MTLPELAVMQQAFELLQPLDPEARRRVLRWVKAALEEAESSPAPEAAEPAGAEAPPVIEAAGTSVAPEPAAAEESAVAPAAASADEVPAETPAETPAEAPSAAPAAERRGRRAAKTAVKSTRRRAADKTAADKPAADKTAANKTKAAAEEPAPPARNGGRGRPPADEIMRVYREVDGKLTDLAEHYGKPYGTIQGWASALRKQGYPIGRSRTS